MIKRIGRKEAAELLGCTTQTIANYVKDGLLDEFRSNTTGAGSIQYDENQVLALLPQLRELEELKANIQKVKDENKKLLHQEIELRNLRRKQVLLYMRSEKTWKYYRELIHGAYEFMAGSVKDRYLDFDSRVLNLILEGNSMEDISVYTDTKPQDAVYAIKRIARNLIQLGPAMEIIKRQEDEIACLKEELAELKSK